MAVGSVTAKLTQKQIENLKPGDKRREITDGTGLYLIIQPRGARSWACRYCMRAAEEADAWPLFAARPGDARKARKARAAVDAGADPQGEKSQARRPRASLSIPTMTNLRRRPRPFSKTMSSASSTEQSEAGRARSSVGSPLRWRGRKLSEIAPRDIHALLDEILAAGHGTTACRTPIGFIRFFAGPAGASLSASTLAPTSTRRRGSAARAVLE